MGIATRTYCAIPLCGHRVESRGLCSSCAAQYRRYGMDGLRRRATKLAKGQRHVRVPKTKEEASHRLEQAAITLAHVDSDRDSDYAEAKHSLERMAIAYAVAAGAVERQYQRRYKERFIEQYGLAEWKARHAERQRRHKAKKKLTKRVSDVR